ncbi:hypothetical protein HZB00_02320 [Candidatus Woesearchaeota archaeon]|nr:hypothetical protein [Candidatus Woesearchaeota archaeon]
MVASYRKKLKRLWHFIWEEDSFASWVVNVLLAFILVKFVIYPGLGFLLGTQFPVVAVVSGSMEHDGNFNTWWESQRSYYTNINITQEEFLQYSFRNGFNKGDLMILIGAKQIQRGDVLVFQGAVPDPIIHRVVKVYPGSYQTKGDHNTGSRQDEVSITDDRIYGKAVFRIPYLGWFKILFVELIQEIIHLVQSAFA